jgi:hypothetical protein
MLLRTLAVIIRAPLIGVSFLVYPCLTTRPGRFRFILNGEKGFFGRGRSPARRNEQQYSWQWAITQNEIPFYHQFQTSVQAHAGVPANMLASGWVGSYSRLWIGRGNRPSARPSRSCGGAAVLSDHGMSSG